MKKVSKAAVLPLCLILLSTSGSIAAPNNAQEKKQVMETLDRMGEAIVQKDIPVLKDLLHEDLTFGPSSGDIQSKDDLLNDVSNPKRVWEMFKFSDPTVHFYGPTAVVRCLADIRNGSPGNLHEG